MKKIFSSTIFIFLLALTVAVFTVNYNGNSWEDKVRNILYRAKGDSIPSSATEYVDSNGVPYVHYIAENGIAATTQYNATIVANYALQYFNDFKAKNDSSSLKKFFNCYHFLKDSVTTINNISLYHFNWQQGWYPHIKPPFTSAMTNGRTIEVCLNAFEISHDSAHLSFAHKLLNAFFVDINNGGFTYKTSDTTWWFEEMAKPNTATPHILDGHIFALQGIQKYWQQTKSDSAKIILQNGLQGLKSQLANYDAGNGKLYYDISKKTADKKYQKIITTQMLQLWQTTNDSAFLQYYNKWMQPLQKPYVQTVLQERNISGIALIIFITTLFFVFLLLAKKLVVKNK